MSEFKRGDKVLIDDYRYFVSGPEEDGSCVVGGRNGPQEYGWQGSALIPYPGVPVAALLKELGLLWEMVAEAEQETFTSTVAQNLLAEADVLHDTREAAEKPNSGGYDFCAEGPLFPTHLMGRSVSEWGEILNYARLHGWGPPKLKEGQEVWVRGKRRYGDCYLVGSADDAVVVTYVHPDDIRTEKP